MLATEISGTGVPLVFLHAYPLNRRMWIAQAAKFSRNFKTVLIDFPGFGESKPEGDRLSLSQYADRVLETLDAKGIREPFVLTGLSMGGYVAFRVWEKVPNRIRAMVLVSTRAIPDSEQARDRRYKTVEVVTQKGVEPLVEMMKPALLGKTTLATKPDLVNEVSQEIRRATPQGVCAALRGMAERPDSSPLLQLINCPSLVLAGEEDTVIPAADMEAMSKNLKESEYHLFPKAGHLLNLESPDLFQDRYLHFLKRRVL